MHSSPKFKSQYYLDHDYVLGVLIFFLLAVILSSHFPLLFFSLPILTVVAPPPHFPPFPYFHFPRPSFLTRRSFDLLQNLSVSSTCQEARRILRAVYKLP